MAGITSKKDKAAPVAADRVLVVRTRYLKEFRRAGFVFGLAPRTIRIDELTTDQLEAIRAEPMLTVTDGVDG